MNTYKVGWNIPGYLPDEEPQSVQSFEDAVGHLLAELEEHASIVQFSTDSTTTDSTSTEPDWEDPSVEPEQVLRDIEAAKKAVEQWSLNSFPPGTGAHWAVKVGVWVYWIDQVSEERWY